MSRSGYSDDLDQWALIRWRGRVASAIRGKRGQTMLVALRDALDAMSKKSLVVGELITAEGDCCAMGCLAQSRGIDTSEIDPHDPDEVAALFDIAPCLAQEIAYSNDEGGSSNFEQTGEGWRYIFDTPEHRWRRMRDWVERNIAKPAI